MLSNIISPSELGTHAPSANQNEAASKALARGRKSDDHHKTDLNQVASQSPTQSPFEQALAKEATNSDDNKTLESPPVQPESLETLESTAFDFEPIIVTQLAVETPTQYPDSPPGGTSHEKHVPVAVASLNLNPTENNIAPGEADDSASLSRLEIETKKPNTDPSNVLLSDTPISNSKNPTADTTGQDHVPVEASTLPISATTELDHDRSTLNSDPVATTKPTVSLPQTPLQSTEPISTPDRSDHESTDPSTPLQLETDLESNADQSSDLEHHDTTTTSEPQSENGSQQPGNAPISLDLKFEAGATSDPVLRQLSGTEYVPSTHTETNAEIVAIEPNVLDSGLRATPQNSNRQPFDNSISPTARAVLNKVSDSLIQEMSIQSNEESKTLTLKLNPQELGRLTLHLVWENESVKAHIIATEQATSDMLSRDKSLLLETLESNGLQFDSFDISHGETQSNESDAESSRLFKTSGTLENESAPTQSNHYVTDAQGSVVNLIA